MADTGYGNSLYMSLTKPEQRLAALIIVMLNLDENNDLDVTNVALFIRNFKKEV